MKTLLSVLFITFSLVSCEHLSQEEVIQQFGSESDGSMFLQLEGKAIHYRTSGNENGSVILMLPGITDSLHTFDPIVQGFEAEYKVVRVDVPGMGLSDGLDWDNDRFIDQLNKRLVKFMGALQINEFHVLGHSFGGLLAWTMALAYPKNVDKVVLLSPSAYKQKIFLGMRADNAVSEFFLRNNGAFNLELTYDLLIKYKDDFVGVRGSYDKDLVDAQVERLATIFYAENNADKYTDFLSLLPDYDYAHSKNISKLDKDKVLLIFGDRDQWVVPFQEQITNWRRDLKGVQEVILNEIGHLVHWALPNEVVSRSSAFLRK